MPPTPKPTIWTEADLRALGLFTDLTTAASVLGLSRAVAYDLADRDEFPVPVTRAGRRWLVAVPALLALAGLPKDVEPIDSQKLRDPT